MQPSRAIEVKRFLLVACLWLPSLPGCSDPQPEVSAWATEPDRLRCLVEGYPEQIDAIEDAAVVWRDGTRMPYDDGRLSSPAERLENPDLADQLAQPYPVGPGHSPPVPGFDPGRVRFLPMFHKIYGRNRAEVESHLVTVPWLPGGSEQELRVTSVNGVDERLRAVSAAILRLPDEVRVRAAEVAGGYNWRTIAGTTRQSAHSFGIAVDLGVKWADYWRWNEPDANGAIPHRNRIPFEIVEAFEREGFIWGGRWYHFDTMHFEYRPELLVERCVSRQLPGANSVGPPDSGGRNLTAGTPPASASSTQR